MTRPIDPALTEHYRRSIQDWLDRELPGLGVTAKGTRFTIDGRYHLRLDPETARWQLYRHTRRHDPGKPCLSLTDWLNQLRQIVTNAAKKGVL